MQLELAIIGTMQCPSAFTEVVLHCWNLPLTSTCYGHLLGGLHSLRALYIDVQALVPLYFIRRRDEITNTSDGVFSLFHAKTKHSSVEIIARSRRQTIAIDMFRNYCTSVTKIYNRASYLSLVWLSCFMLHLMFVIVLVLVMTLLCIAYIVQTYITITQLVKQH